MKVILLAFYNSNVGNCHYCELCQLCYCFGIFLASLPARWPVLVDTVRRGD